jgi:predicted O-methyltransferase YrrM
MLPVHFLQNRPRALNWLHQLGLAQPFSQTDPAERACLCKHLTGAKTVVEIGTFMGITAAEMAAAMDEDAVLYCIDPYYSGDNIEQIARRHLERQGVIKRVRRLRKTATEATVDLPPVVDFFFVDGDHSWSGLEKDWQVVKQLLKPGGIAAFHDTKHVPESDRNSLEAIDYFNKVIALDQEFAPLDSCLSLQVIRRKA